MTVNICIKNKVLIGKLENMLPFCDLGLPVLKWLVGNVTVELLHDFHGQLSKWRIAFSTRIFKY